MGKMIILTFKDNEEAIIQKIVSLLANEFPSEVIQQSVFSPIISFPGLEIRQSQHRVFQGGEEVNLTRLEYSTLVSAILAIQALLM